MISYLTNRYIFTFIDDDKVIDKAEGFKLLVDDINVRIVINPECARIVDISFSNFKNLSDIPLSKEEKCKMLSSDEAFFVKRLRDAKSGSLVWAYPPALMPESRH